MDPKLENTAATRLRRLAADVKHLTTFLDIASSPKLGDSLMDPTLENTKATRLRQLTADAKHLTFLNTSSSPGLRKLSANVTGTTECTLSGGRNTAPQDFLNKSSSLGLRKLSSSSPPRLRERNSTGSTNVSNQSVSPKNTAIYSRSKSTLPRTRLSSTGASSPTSTSTHRLLGSVSTPVFGNCGCSSVGIAFAA